MQPKQKLHYIYIKNMFESLLNKLINFDKFLMVMLNYDGGDIQDMIWWCISSRLIWVPIALTLIVYMLRDTKKWKQAVVMILAIALIVTICDQVSSTLMKPYFARLLREPAPLRLWLPWWQVRFPIEPRRQRLRVGDIRCSLAAQPHSHYTAVRIRLHGELLAHLSWGAFPH